VSEPTEILGALADDSRLRAFSAILLGATSSSEVADATGLQTKDALRALSSLQSVGLVSRTEAGWTAHPDQIRAAAIAAAPPRQYVDHGTGDAHTASVLRTFLPEGRISQMPTSRSKRLVVLDHVARVFEPGVRYPEADVTAMLSAFYDDYAALRRYLVDEGFLAREAGTYWRTGGTVEV